MKKIFFSVFLFSLLFQAGLAQDSIDFGQIRDYIKEKQKAFELSYDEESEYWDYFINVFLPDRLTGLNPPLKYRDDIKILLINDNKYDSIAANTIINEIAYLIPNNISQTDKKEEANLILELLSFDSGRNEVQGPPSFHNQVNLVRDNIVTVGDEIKERYFSSIISDSVSQENRSKIVRYFIVRGLTNARKIQNHWSIFTPDMYKEVRNELAHGYYDFNERDKFCLSKLYAADLEAQLEEYIYRKNGLWYYLNFFWPKQSIIGLKVVIYLLCFLFVIAFSYKTVLTRKFKRPYLSYLVNALLMSVIIALWFYIYVSTPIITNFEGIYSRPEYFSMRILYRFLSITAIIIVLATALFFLEKHLLKEKHGLLQNVALKMLFTLAVPILVLTLILYVLILFADGEPDYGDKSGIAMSVIYIAVFALGRGIFLYFKERADALLRQKDVELSKLKELKAKAEVASLHARINPHFLYNSLNSIAGLAHSDADKTEKMALSLSDLFRHNINRENQSMTAINDEIEAVKSYLEIEQIRFGERMEFSIVMDKGIEKIKIPRNIIQPLVENAIKHGLSKIRGKGNIEIAIGKNENGIEISVHDNGPDFPEGLVSGYGLQSIHDILNLTYKNQAILNFENNPKKRIWIGITKKGLLKKGING